MVDIQSATAEIRQGKKRKKKDRTQYTHTHTHTHTTTVLQPFVRDYPGEPVPEETITHPPS